MQKKNDNFLDKIVKKDYNNQLEKVLEKKYFEENVKNILLSILYKIETSYKDYKQVKQNVETKDEFIENIINNIQRNCDDIKLVKPHSEESKIIGNKTFLVEKKKKRIICYHMERKLLYCISKISKKDKIVKNKYFLVNETLSNLINTGNNINTVEAIRDFNGYSWTTIPQEIESIEHNLIYQNLLILVGCNFLNKWINNEEVMLDYMELFQEKMERRYGKRNSNDFIELLKKISILIEAKFDSKKKEKILKLKEEVEDELEKLEDNEEFVEEITRKKRKITNEIKMIDETLNNKDMIQKEYIRRNENLPLEEKIFSIRILSKLMVDERDEKIQELEKLNQLLNPQKFVKYKKSFEEKEKYLEILNTSDIQEDINNLKLKLQKVFLQCFKIKIEKADNKQDVLKLIYELRYYFLLPYDYNNMIYQVEELREGIKELEKLLLKKAHHQKVIETFSKQEHIDYELLKSIFCTRSINLEDIYIKLSKEKDKFFIHTFDGNSFEEKVEIENIENLNKKDLQIRLNKKVKAFY